MSQRLRPPSLKRMTSYSIHHPANQRPPIPSFYKCASSQISLNLLRTLPSIPTTSTGPSRSSTTRRRIRSSPLPIVIILTPIRIGIVITPILITIMVRIAVRGSGAVVTGTIVISRGVLAGGFEGVVLAVVVFWHFER